MTNCMSICLVIITSYCTRQAAIEELGSRDNVSVLLVVLSPNRPSTAPTASGKR